MFGFSKAVFDSVISNLKGTSTSMEADSKSYTNQAQTLLHQAETFLSQAQGFLSQAQGFLSHIPNFKWVDVTTTDSEGNATTTQERQPDPAQDASDKASAAECQQKAEDCKAKAKDCKTNAGVLQSLAKALLAQVAKLMESILGFTKAGEATQTAITNSTNLLVGGASMLGKVISAFNVPEAKNFGDWAKGVGNNLLKSYVGVDLSDGFDTDDLKGISTTIVKTGAVVAKGFASVTVASLISSTPLGKTPLGTMATNAVITGIINPTVDKLFGEKAVEVVNTGIISGLGFLGITIPEPKKKEEEPETVELDTAPAEEAVEATQKETGTGEAGAGTGGTQKGAEATPKLSFEEIANQILQGKWGNGHATRQAKLMEAGYISTSEEYQKICKIVEIDRAEQKYSEAKKAEEAAQIVVEQTKIAQDEAKASLDSAKKAYDKMFGNSNQNGSAESEATKNLTRLQEAYDNAIAEHSQAVVNHSGLKSERTRAWNNLNKLGGTSK